jgi:hypothetical protein
MPPPRPGLLAIGPPGGGATLAAAWQGGECTYRSAQGSAERAAGRAFGSTARALGVAYGRSPRSAQKYALTPTAVSTISSVGVTAKGRHEGLLRHRLLREAHGFEGVRRGQERLNAVAQAEIVDAGREAVLEPSPERGERRSAPVAAATNGSTATVAALEPALEDRYAYVAYRRWGNPAGRTLVTESVPTTSPAVLPTLTTERFDSGRISSCPRSSNVLSADSPDSNSLRIAPSVSLTSR